MRLYLKLLAMLLIAIVVQSRVPAGPGRSELWFAVRCHIAVLTNDHALQDRLVDEQYQILRHEREEPVSHMNASGPGAG